MFFDIGKRILAIVCAEGIHYSEKTEGITSFVKMKRFISTAKEKAAPIGTACKIYNQFPDNRGLDSFIINNPFPDCIELNSFIISNPFPINGLAFRRIEQMLP